MVCAVCAYNTPPTVVQTALHRFACISRLAPPAYCYYVYFEIYNLNTNEWTVGDIIALPVASGQLNTASYFVNFIIQATDFS